MQLTTIYDNNQLKYAITFNYRLLDWDKNVLVILCEESITMSTLPWRADDNPYWFGMGWSFVA